MKNFEIILTKYLLCFIFGIVLYYIINMMCNCNNGFSIGIPAEYETCTNDDDCDDGLACKDHLDTPDTICYDMSKVPQGVAECYFLIPFTDREKQLHEQIKLVIVFGMEGVNSPAATAIQNLYTYYRILTFFKLCIDKYIQSPNSEISNIGYSLDIKKQKEKVSNFVKNIISLYAILKIILFDEVAVPDDDPIPHQYYYFSNYADARNPSDLSEKVNPADKIKPIIEALNPGKMKQNKFEKRFTNKFTWNNNEEMTSLADNINEFLKDIVTAGKDENDAFTLLRAVVQKEIGAVYYNPIITILINIDKCLGRKYGTAPPAAASNIAQPGGQPTSVQSFYYPKVKNNSDECEHDYECMSMNCKDGTCNPARSPGLNLGEYCIRSFINDKSQQCNNITDFAPMVKPDLLNDINASCIWIDPYGGTTIYARAPQGENTSPDDENRLGNCLIDIMDETIFDKIYSRLPVFTESLKYEKLRPVCLSVEELKELSESMAISAAASTKPPFALPQQSPIEEIFTGVRIGPLIKSVTVSGFFKASGNEYSLVWLQYNTRSNIIELYDEPDGQVPNDIYKESADYYMELATTDKRFAPIKTNSFVKQASQWPMSTVNLSPINMCELRRLEGPLNAPLETGNPPDNYDEPYGRFMLYNSGDPVIKLHSLGGRTDKFVQHAAYPEKFNQMWSFFNSILSMHRDFFGMFQISSYISGYSPLFIYYNKRSNTIESSPNEVSINTEEPLDSLIDINDIVNIYIYDKLSLTASYSFFNSEEKEYEKSLLNTRLDGRRQVRADGTIYNEDSIKLYKKWLIDVLYEKIMNQLVQAGAHRNESQKNNVQFSHYIKIELRNGDFKIFKTGGTGNTQIGSIFIRNKFAIYLHDIVVNLNQATQVGGGAAGSMPKFFIGDPEDTEFSGKRPPHIAIDLNNKALHKALYGTYFMP